MGESMSTVSNKSNAGRAWLAGVLIVLGVVMTPAAILTHWATAQVTSTQRFVETLSPLASNPAVQNTVIAEVTKAIDNAVDVDAVTDSLLGGLGTALNLPEAAKKALGLVSDPIAGGVKNLINDVVTKAVQSDAFQTAWTKTLTITQEQAVDLLSGNGKAVVSLSNDGTISLPLKPIIADLKASMVAKGVAFANLIPVIDTTVTLAKIPELATARVIYQIGTGVGAWLPWVALAFFIVGIAVANKRARALMATGITLAILMAVMGIAVGVSRVFVTATLPSSYSGAAGVIYDAVLSFALVVIAAVGVSGVIAALIGWSFGASVTAAKMRVWFNAQFNTLRRIIAPQSESMARVSTQLHSFRYVARTIIIVGLAAATLAISPLNSWAVIGFTALALVLLAAYEVISRSLAAPQPAAAGKTPAKAAAARKPAVKKPTTSKG